MFLELLQSFNFGTILIFLFVFYLSWRFITIRRLPPGPWGYPIIGSVPRFDFSKISTFRDLRKMYGDLFTIRSGLQTIVYVNGYDTLRDVFITHGDKTSDRPNLHSFNVLVKKSGVLASSGADWKNIRTFSLCTLRDFGFGKRSLQSRIREEIEILLQEVEKNVNKPFNIKHLLQMSVSNIICSIVFGDRFDYTDEEFIQQMDDMSEEMRLKFAAWVVNSFPFARHLPGDLFKIKRLESVLKSETDRIDKHIEAHRRSMNPDEPRDYIDALLIEQKSNDWLTDNHVRFNIRELFVAGTDTTATTIRWALLYFSFYPDIQERLWKEIDDVVGTARLPTMEDKVNMPYTQAVITETLRMANTVPLGLPHATSCDFHFRGYVIPKGTTITPALSSFTADPGMFPEPEVFNPSRFIDEKGKLMGQEKVLTFSLGKRVCLGESLARMELFLFITALVQRFRFRFEDEQKPQSITGVVGVVHAPMDFNLIISKR